MKVKLENGDEVECTVEEYLALKRDQKVQKVANEVLNASKLAAAFAVSEVAQQALEPKNVTKVVVVKQQATALPSKSKKHTAWSDFEVNFLRHNADKSVQDISKHLGRTEYGVQDKVWKLGGLLKLRAQLAQLRNGERKRLGYIGKIKAVAHAKKKKPRVVLKPDAGNRVRGKFIATRGNSYMKQYGWTIERDRKSVV